VKKLHGAILAVFSFGEYSKGMKWKLLALFIFVFLCGFTFKEKKIYAYTLLPVNITDTSKPTINTSAVSPNFSYTAISVDSGICSGTNYMNAITGSKNINSDAGSVTPGGTTWDLSGTLFGGGMIPATSTSFYISYGTISPNVCNNYVFHLVKIGGVWQNDPSITSTHFTSITVSTTTNKLNFKGYWQASSTILVTQSTENATYALNLYPETFGGSGFTNSTSTGNFDLNFRIFQQGCVSETSSTTICTTDQVYTYTGVLYDGSYPNQQYPYKDIATTSLEYPYQGTSTIFVSDFTNQFYNATIGTSTLIDSSNFLSFLNVPRLLQERAPFAYIFQIANAVYSGINSSSTTPIPSGNFVWKNTQNGTTTIDMFSPTTIKVYMSDSIIALWRAFLLVVLVINFAYALYYETKRHHII